MMLIAAAALAYVPLAVTFILYARAKRYPYASQVFNDSVRKLGGLVTMASFLLIIPAVYLLLFDEHITAQIPWDEERTSLLFSAWLAAYPLTVAVFHALRAKIRKGEPYAAPYPVAGNIARDILKHGLLAALFLVAVYAGGKALRPANMTTLHNVTGQNAIAS